MVDLDALSLRMRRVEGRYDRGIVGHAHPFSFVLRSHDFDNYPPLIHIHLWIE
jgi:hypothetical protein